MSNHCHNSQNADFSKGFQTEYEKDAATRIETEAIEARNEAAEIGKNKKQYPTKECELWYLSGFKEGYEAGASAYFKQASNHEQTIKINNECTAPLRSYVCNHADANAGDNVFDFVLKKAKKYDEIKDHFNKIVSSGKNAIEVAWDSGFTVGKLAGSEKAIHTERNAMQARLTSVDIEWAKKCRVLELKLKAITDAAQSLSNIMPSGNNLHYFHAKQEVITLRKTLAEIQKDTK